VARSANSLRDLSGRYTLRENVNYTVFLMELGVGWAIRTAADRAGMSLRITHDEEGGSFVLAIEGFRSRKTRYTIGGEGVETFVGRVAFWDYLTEEENGNNKNPSGHVVFTRKVCEEKGLRVVVERYFEDDEGEVLVVKQSVVEGLGEGKAGGGKGGGKVRVIAYQYFDRVE